MNNVQWSLDTNLGKILTSLLFSFDVLWNFYLHLNRQWGPDSYILITNMPLFAISQSNWSTFSQKSQSLSSESYHRSNQSVWPQYQDARLKEFSVLLSDAQGSHTTQHHTATAEGRRSREKWLISKTENCWMFRVIRRWGFVVGVKGRLVRG